MKLLYLYGDGSHILEKHSFFTENGKRDSIKDIPFFTEKYPICRMENSFLLLYGENIYLTCVPLFWETVPPFTKNIHFLQRKVPFFSEKVTIPMERISFYDTQIFIEKQTKATTPSKFRVTVTPQFWTSFRPFFKGGEDGRGYIKIKTTTLCEI